MVLVNNQLVPEVTLRSAIEEANSTFSTSLNPTIISFLVTATATVEEGEGAPPPLPPPAPKTIVLTAPIEDIHCFVQINGPGRDLLTITRNTATAGFRFFSIADTPNVAACAVTFKDMTIRDSGYSPINFARGGAFSVANSGQNAANLTLENVNLFENQANQGGAVYVGASSGLVLKNCVVDQNEVIGAGLEGGAIRVTGNGQLKIYSSTLSNNKAIGAKGGAISINFQSLAELYDSHLLANQADIGGAAYISGGNANVITFKMIGGSAVCNSATSKGGALFLSTANAIIDGVEFSGNSAGKGGALYIKYQKVEIYNSTFDQNSASILGPIIAYHGEILVNPDTWIYLTGSTGVTNADRIYDPLP
ncbi:hypothetical protein J8F10_35355 [Gemmata sp. G18]|uniref:Right-handed parallel beta-helix repeat-containing protein n=1 Tax=Gemmata palustris TaxID=2822762 RepID=A0ABS5C3H8_9BACT|nr:hypothetical protein [Gemmata palustris]MBP3960532.1 hypothetical protein [Gemmata palustris]